MSTSDLRQSPTPSARGGGFGQRLLVFVPLIAFFALAALFFVRLGAGDPSRIPSALIGHEVPHFALASLPGRAGSGLDDAQLRAGHVTLVNFFASWCPQCVDEHDLLLQLAGDDRLKARGVLLDGIVYKDVPANARRYLDSKGDPFAALGTDPSGRTGIDFGVYGVPETFVVRGDGTIAYKVIGPITPDNVDTLFAEIDKAAKQ
jgi:cytochrome c biogenesis protein CcmG/thiol:disulfide interchange protein DsbE